MKKQNMIRWIAGAALGIACVGFGIHAYYRYEEREAAVQEMEARGQQENKDAEDQKNGILTWNGKKYRRNTAMRAILCMGIDTKGEMASQVVSGKGGDADAIFLIAEDASRDQAQIVLIPRNTMTEIEVFDYFGGTSGDRDTAADAAYAFGDGREESCELTAEALSKLYLVLRSTDLAVNMDSIPYS